MTAPMPRPTVRPDARGVVHVAREDDQTPGVCRTCRRPLALRNDRHVDHPADIPPAPRGPQDWAAGDLED